MANEKRLINQKVMEKQIKEAFKDNPYLMGQMLRWIRSLPKVDAVEVVHGEWLDGYGVCDNKKSYISIDCSNCGEYFKLPSVDENIEEWKKRFAYCPFCGADMRGKTE